LAREAMASAKLALVAESVVENFHLRRVLRMVYRMKGI